MDKRVKMDIIVDCIAIALLIYGLYFQLPRECNTLLLGAHMCPCNESHVRWLNESQLREVLNDYNTTIGYELDGAKSYVYPQK
jgi:hypothetical protein